MDWEGSPSSSPQSQQRASPQRSPPRTTTTTTTLPSSSTTPSSFVMLPPPRTSSPSSSSASVVRAGAGATSRARVSSLSPTASPSHSQSHSSNIIVTHVSSAHDVTNTSSPPISLSSSPLELTGPRSKHPQVAVVVGSTSPSRSPSAAPHSYSLSGPKSPVVLISSTTSSASSSTESSSSASLNSWKSSSSSVAGRLQLGQVYHHHHHHHPEFHSQTRNPTTTTSTTDETNSCGAVALVAANKTPIQDQPEELVVTPTSSSSSAIAGQQKQLVHHNQGVPSLSSSSCSRTSSTSPVSSSISSTLLLRRHHHADAEVEEETGDKEQKHPTDLSNPTKTTSQQHQKNSSRNEQCDEQERRAHHQHQHLQKQTSSSSSSSSHQVLSLSIRKNKPIPPPLDLSIGASSLSLHHHHQHQHPHHNTIISSNSNTTINTTNHNHSYSIPNAANQSTQHQQQIHNPQQQPTSPFFLGSPKFADKSLPLRKRWQSWSPPTQMNGQEHSDQASAAVSSAAVVAATGSPSSSSGSSMVPLYSDSQQQHHNPMASKTGLAGVGSAASVTTSGDSNNGTGPGSAGIYGNRSWVLDVVPLSAPPITTSARNSTNHHHHHHHPHGISTNSLASSSNNTNNHTNPSNTNNNNTSSIPNSLGLHTPTPFFTPNEPSPKFMNSPVFSYSNPDTSLYQGPFSPIRASSLYPPPSSPFTNLSLNSPLPPLQSSVGSNSSSSSSSSSSGSGSGGGTPASGAGGGIMGNPCFNMIPSTLLSPAPSQASTNSLSYEDLHEKSLSCFTPVWSVFMSGTKVRFVGGMNSMDWYLVDFLAQSGDSLLGLKGEYAPHGLEVRKLVMTSSPKERVQLTFCPVADPNHPTMEVNCEPGHPFMVDKKGWCAVKPEVFQETYGALCQQLECGDICLNLNISRSPNNNNNNVIAINNNANFLHHQQSLLHHNSGFHNALIHGQNHAPSSSTGVPNYNNTIINTSSGSIGGVPANVLANMHNISHLHSGSNHINNNNNNSIGNPPMSSLMTSTLSPPSIKMETIDEKPIPISVLPQNPQSGIHMSIMQSPPPPPMQHQQSHHHHQRHLGGNGAGNSRKTSAAHSHVPPGSPAKRAKDGKDAQGGDGQPAKGRRPMNAFLLFAKDKRPELIQKYPGKDNRTISVLLGEAWQKLAPPERERYSSNAKARAEEQKRIHPDCWKRKRSQSTSS